MQSGIEYNYGPGGKNLVFGVSDKARLKTISSATDTSQKIEISLVATFQKENNKGTDQSVQMPRLVCVVCKPRKDRFSRVETHILFTVRSLVEYSSYRVHVSFIKFCLASK